MGDEDTRYDNKIMFEDVQLILRVLSVEKFVVGERSDFFLWGSPLQSKWQISSPQLLTTIDDEKFKE